MDDLTLLFVLSVQKVNFSPQVAGDGSSGTERVRLGPHARRRAAKHVVIIQEDSQKTVTEEKSS